jgi:hypothetical protein
VLLKEAQDKPMNELDKDLGFQARDLVVDLKQERKRLGRYDLI